ncbi:MAG TPA: TonB family protein [Candidatus Polarisedimenticolaceae bacterium]|nr:TonB family protein [Candidatus Polarisedimenticolaceae bacterium]
MAHRTILLIDYEPRSIERFRQPLTDAGYGVEVATDGVSGIEAFHRLSPDMVLVEAMIPKRHGFEVCQELKRTPHGKRTPVLITTGVYKGRKYRTQALHIYGCDEYIEKPIAPEQLLAVVGKFFSGSASAGSGGGESREAAGVTASEPAATAKAITVEPAPARPVPMKSSTTPSVIKDFTEEEIMARLDAILPGNELVPSPPAEIPPPIEVAPAPIAEMPVVEPMAHEIDDPFAQMQKELTAELGSMSGSLALEAAPVFDPMPQTFPSDQEAAPSLLESLPVQEEVAAPAPPETAPAAETPGQLVNFEAGRSRRKKKGKAQASPAPQPPPAPARVTPIAETARPQAPLPPVATMTLPQGTLAEAELAGKPARRGVPVWIWALLVLAGLAAAGYFVFMKPSVSSAESSTSETVPAPHRAPEPAAQAPTPAPQPPSVVLNAIQPLPQRPAPLATASTPSATKPAAKTEQAELPKATPPHQFPATKPSPSSQQKAAEPVPIAAPAGADEGVPSVEPVDLPAAAAAAPSVVPGTTVDSAEAETSPVSLSRKLPVYSMQARQLRIQGTVVMKVLVNEQGTVDDVTLVQGVPGADLNEAAVRAARSWTYRPATKAGVPVKVWKIEQVTFKM